MTSWYPRALVAASILSVASLSFVSTFDRANAATEPSVDGSKLYAQKCATCHGGKLQGAHGPALKGKTFAAVWKGRTARNLYSKIRLTMPIAEPGTLTEQQAVAITNHILAGSKIKPAKKPVTANDLATIQLKFP